MIGSTNQRAVVITGSSSGIGKAIALAAANQGYDILVHGHANEIGAQDTVAAVRSVGRDAHLVMADIAAESGRTAIIESAFDWRSHIDSWVHCAGVDVLTGSLANADFATKFDQLWNVDVRGTILLAQAIAAAPQTQRSHSDLEQRPQSMLFIGWDQANHGMEGTAGQMFGPIKAAVMSFATNLAQELAPRFRVNCIAPGWIRTAWGENTDDYWNRRATRSALMNRWGTPEDIAALAVFLMSPAASFINGQTIDVNGGWNRRIQ